MQETEVDSTYHFHNSTVDVDFVGTNPTAPSYIQQASKIQLHAANLAVAEKHNNHRNRPARRLAAASAAVSASSSSSSSSVAAVVFGSSINNNTNNNLINNNVADDWASELGFDESINILSQELSSVPLIAFAFEAFGGLHQDARKIKDIAIAAQDHTFVFNRDEIVNGIKSGVAIAIAKGNAL